MIHPPAGTITFFGAAGTVTGSKYFINTGTRRLLLECGLFQGEKSLRRRNWAPFPVDPASLDAVVLSHAHLDHAGALPLLVREGFRGPVLCTGGTADLLPLLLRDSARIQEEDAARANRHGYTRHHPALPLYTLDDVERTLPLLRPQGYGRLADAGGIGVQFHRAGHIIGSAVVELELGAGAGGRLVFSGDLGRWGRPILRDPELVTQADTLLVESTYGGRTHATDAESAIAEAISEAAHRGGAVVVPAFAIGRTQELIWTIRKLEEERRIPLVSVYIDSPMATAVTELYCRHPEDHDLDMETLMDERRCPLCCRQYHIARTSEESKRLNGLSGPLVIVAGSGMVTGGRVLHHLKRRLPDHRNTVLLAGYQAAGTRGRALQDGAAEIKIHGEVIPVRARVVTVDGLSAHADQGELLRWLRGFRQPPRQGYVVHGEPSATAALVGAIRTELGWKADAAVDGETVALTW